VGMLQKPRGRTVKSLTATSSKRKKKKYNSGIKHPDYVEIKNFF